MPYRWPEGTVFRRFELEVEDRTCQVCHDGMYVCDHRHHRIFTLGGPVHLVSNQVESLVLCIDGLQPEKGHETLYVVRELSRKRVWFAESLISSTAAEVRRLLVQAREWAARLGKPVRGWMSDKQEAFRSGIAAEFPGIPHRYCRNHFLRDLAQPVLDLDSHAKVQMRAKVRGLRAIEREVLQAGRPPTATLPPVLERSGTSAAPRPVESLAVAEPRPVLAEEAPSPTVSPSVPAAPVLEQAGASAALRPVESLALAEPRPVLAGEDPSPAVSPSVPAAPVLERGARPPDIAPEPPDAGEVVLDC